MPNFNSHIKIAIVVYPFLLFGHEFLSIIFQYPKPSNEIIGIGFLLFLVSSDLPDIDHSHSYLRRIFIIFVNIIVTYVEFTKEIIIKLLKFNYLIPSWYSLKFAFSLFVGILTSKLVDVIIPKHRGPLHSVWMAFIFGLMVSGYYWYMFSIMKNAVFLGIISTTGYILHLILDKFFYERRGKLVLKRKG
ncbi:MAG: metal-dependent hydrolase [Thermosipho sp. (in: Bacteria)]|nr:metal-dependent hydrolase [Thermosipho sp. (in: thermotogales)]